MFKVSDKVVCVKKLKARRSFKPAPEVGKVYVIREVDLDRDDGPALRLVGIQGAQEDGEECWLWAGLFRALTDLQKPEATGRLSAPAETRTIPLITDMQWMTPERENQLLGAVDAVMKALGSVLDGARDLLARGGWQDSEGRLLACVMSAWDERRRSMDEDTTGKAGRTFFGSHPKVGSTVKIIHVGTALRAQIAWAYRGEWHDALYRTDAVCRAFDGRYFLVRETEPHCFVPPPHADRLRGLVRVKRITAHAARLFALRDGLFAFSQDALTLVAATRLEMGSRRLRQGEKKEAA